ncbi:MAG TPA: branched-chain amino acid ABC transporter permease [Paracoccaceae bacterium]|nr:branched-chain amino acid ABC transporter permease [Paracoccaceae bacterium]
MGDMISLIISGIANGSAFALLALGVVIIFRSTDTVNFAIGDTGTLATFAALSAISAGAPILLACLLAILLAGVIGIVSERLLVRPLGHGPHLLFVALVITIGLGLVMQAGMGAVWGHTPKPFPPLVPGWIDVAGVAISLNKIAATLVALIAMGIVAWFFGFRPFGIAMRAGAEDPFAARMIGLKIGRMSSIAWFLGCGLAAIAMLFLAAESALHPHIAHSPLFRAFAGVFLGGLTSMPGAVIGGFAIGVLDNIAGHYISANYRDTIVFTIIVLVLFARPAGFMGTIRKERV